ncbi:hypothetical protein FFZ96_01070 [Leptospira borgpetersenii]|nr:hypothetical protein LBHB_02890 [Leptospira borgpetersenii serovar Hardjo]TQE59343.1 hypothetical protein FFZ96_01070 [Leptospira borgpetersenii]
MRDFTTRQESQQKELRTFAFRRLTNFASLVLDRGQKETEEMLHHGFRMQFAEIKTNKSKLH